MFTGIIEETGRVVSLTPTESGSRLLIHVHTVADGTKIGDSIAVNGCCLTVTEMRDHTLAFDLLDETMRITNLGQLRPDQKVNLERALRPIDRMGGHFVQGHIDCQSAVLAFAQNGAHHKLEIALPSEFARYVVSKGSICINGISLTVAEIAADRIAVWIIPHTLAVTNLCEIKAGNFVNLEFDLLAKYVERIAAN